MGYNVERIMYKCRMVEKRQKVGFEMAENKTIAKASALMQAPKGTVLIKKSTVVDKVFLILKGKVRFQADGSSVVLGPGSFLGINAMYTRIAQGDYVTMEDVTYCVLQELGASPVKRIAEINKEYNGLMVYSLSRFISELWRICYELFTKAAAGMDIVNSVYAAYESIASKEGLRKYDLSFVMSLRATEQPELPVSEEFEYYRDDYKVSPEQHKTYFMESAVMAEVHIKRQSEVIDSLLEINSELAAYLGNCFSALIGMDERNMFSAFTDAAIKLANVSKSNDSAIEKCAYILAETEKIQKFLAENAGLRFEVDRNALLKVMEAAKKGEVHNISNMVDSSNEAEKNRTETLYKMREVKDCLKKILKYAEWDGEEATGFASAMEQFLLCKDKFAGSDEMRSLRRNITKGYFVLYEKVFLKAHKAESIPVAVELFLDYGLTDERLLNAEDLEDVCSITKEEQSLPCRVYTMREWLTCIYEGKKEPSKSEFDMDYFAMLRDRRKRGEITDEQAKMLAVDVKERLKFEITNVFMYNNRLLNSQMSTYVPVMYSESMTGKLAGMHMSRKRLNMIVNKYRDIDRTIFYRELMYENKALGIEKEFIMKEYCPDIILLPIYGSRAVMWQEIEGKRRDSHARFLFPAFYEGNPESAMITAFARFRWELCRTMQGSSWNNIQIKSLTSEYCDYIQFYNKNRDLSEEKREKVKMQIQKAKGSSREAFVMDYELWIKNEVAGSVRLNKVAREILATYCPFNPAIRQKLAPQPMFEDAMARFNREKMKKNNELENHYKALKKIQQLPEELENNQEYYKEL